MTTTLDLIFDWSIKQNTSAPVIYSGLLVPVNTELFPLPGQTQIVPAYETPDFQLGSDDAANNKFLTTAAAAAYYYAAHKTAAMAKVNDALIVDRYDATRLVQVPNGLSDRLGASDKSTVALSAGAANVVTATITLKNDADEAIAAAQVVEVFISRSAVGAGLTATAASGALAATTGAILTALTAKKHIIAVTDANGVLVLTLTDTAKTEGEYFIVKLPGTGKLVVSAATVTASYGA